MERISYDEFFMEQALTFSKRATCTRLKVGTIITSKENIQLAEGYNGSLKGQPHCTDDHVGCLINEQGRCIRTIHAEQNSIINAMRKGVSIVDSIAYVTHEPCETCTKLLIQSGVTTIIYLKAYNNKYNANFLKNGAIIFKEYDGKNKERLLKLEAEINKKPY